MTRIQQYTPARIGQTRADRHGMTVILADFASAGRYLCEYPQSDGDTSKLRPRTIEQLYPTVISGPLANYRR